VLENIEILKKYNFWDSKLPNVGFIRDAYLEKINSFIGNKLVKILVGQRRVGKSYLLRQIIKKLIDDNVNPENIFYLNKEYSDFDFISNYKELDKLINEYKKEIKPQGKIFIFIDEIQNINAWEHLINSYSQDYTQEYELFISGSNSKLLSGELATF
jgi:predicted AAA+ superfamily ATPase